MAYFEWAQDMVIDNGPIDDDHRKLVEQVNLLHSATSQGRAKTWWRSCWAASLPIRKSICAAKSA